MDRLLRRMARAAHAPTTQWGVLSESIEGNEKDSLWTKKSLRDDPSRRWRLSTASLAVVSSTLVCVWIGARWSIGLQGLLSAAWAWPGVGGVPQLCGSDGRSTWLWMNPARFNESFSNTCNTEGPHPLFLVGCGHSGTTPLVALLSLHPQVWMYAPNDALEFSVKPNSFRNVGSFGANWLSAAPSRRDDYHWRQQAVEAKGPNVSRWLVKSPSNVCRLGYIFATLGRSATVVALIRDGRDVMLSLLERYPGVDPAGPLCLGRWVNDNSALLLYEADPRLLILRYEDLFDRSREGYPTLGRLLRHANLDLAPLGTMLADHQRRRPSATLVDRKDASRVRASPEHTQRRINQTSMPFRRSPPRWPTQMTSHLAATFERNRRATYLLAYFGYSNYSANRWRELLVAAGLQTRSDYQ